MDSGCASWHARHLFEPMITQGVAPGAGPTWAETILRKTKTPKGLADDANLAGMSHRKVGWRPVGDG